MAGVVDGHPDAEGQGGLALGDVAVADAVRAVGRDAEGGVESVEGLLAGLEAFLASRKLDSLIVPRSTPTTIPAASSLAWSTVWSRRSPDSRQLGPNCERFVRRRLEWLTICRRSVEDAGHGRP